MYAINTIVDSSILLSSPVSVSDEIGPRCRNFSSTESILGVITSYLESFYKNKNANFFMVCTT